MESYKRFYLLEHAKGFTLIELMVVVAILALVTASGIIAFTSTQRNARDAKRIADVNAMAKAYETYVVDTGNFYGSTNGTCSDTTYWNNIYHSGVATNLSSGALPVPPGVNASDIYCIYSLPINWPTSVNPQGEFCITARLENGKGNCTGGSNAKNDPTGVNCYYVVPGTGTHYCVSNRL